MNKDWIVFTIISVFIATSCIVGLANGQPETQAEIVNRSKPLIDYIEGIVTEQTMGIIPTDEIDLDDLEN